ncbi:hypothetical protein ACJX0J_036795 [Zea mays]
MTTSTLVNIFKTTSQLDFNDHYWEPLKIHHLVILWLERWDTKKLKHPPKMMFTTHPIISCILVFYNKCRFIFYLNHSIFLKALVFRRASLFTLILLLLTI